MSSVKSVIITLPKGVPKAIPRNEPPRSSLPKLNFTTSILVDKARMDGRKGASGGQQEETRDSDADVATLLEPVDTRVRGKKRRLDHLTWEEKLQRKKLKNRVAAQTSRDRKKARLDELEDTVRIQKERNELLTQECAMLRSRNELLTSQNEWLLNENKRLRNERDAVRNTLTDQQQPICSACRTRVDGAVPSLGSAVSLNDPLPQGGTAQSASRSTRTPRATVLLKFLTLYFLLKNCSALSKASTPRDSKSWQRASYATSAQKLRQILIDLMNKCPPKKLPLKNLTIQRHWWGRHQKMWKPIELVEA
ncbi:PREDICTED: X-box-binding protein 1 [Vollenhovia emeryi]|uniref:X-box-binding protein 1 n=1 Tax=Vollenhovia emeryi TaxID=411798 RepID=UPI0005F4F0AA|nr:PREDICTED: X-box-binding protein 1 [Vollenhovia emeryi]